MPKEASDLKIGQCCAWLVELDVGILVENGISQSLSSVSLEERNNQVVEGKRDSSVDETIYSNSTMEPHDFATQERKLKGLDHCLTNLAKSSAVWECRLQRSIRHHYNAGDENRT